MWLINWLRRKKNKFDDLKYVRSLKLRNIRLIYPFVISNRENLVLSDNLYIGPNAWIILKSSGKLRIDEGTLIGPRFKCMVANHNYEGGMLPYSSEYIIKDIWIERNVWIGADVMLLPGTHIGEGAVIGACSVVSGFIPSCAIVAGNPARIIKYRNKENYMKCVEKGNIYLKQNNTGYTYNHVTIY